MRKSLYLINPTTDFAGYYTADVFGASGFPPAVLTADLAITTIAALAPPEIDVSICEEYITPVDLESKADFIGITGKVTQWHRMRTLATEFRKRGKTVLIGGSFASLSPDVVRPHCDVLVRGEIEEIAPEIFSDLLNGTWKAEYHGEKPDLRLSPLPRWDLYPNDRAMSGAVQTSRGCPFECEFCDVIQYAGRKQRHKPVDLVIKELDALYRYGYRNVFLADDNLTVYRARARELLTAIRDWNDRQEQGKVRFLTQVSIDATRDESLLQLTADAGVTHIFIGIETPNQESLKETKKRQNLKVDLVKQVETFVENGIMVMAGMIVGFDHDGPDIFQRQYDFAMASPIPIFSLGTLVAPAATPLYARMKEAERLLPQGSEAAATPWSTNIVPQRMTHQELLAGLQWLCNRLYDPAALEQRILRFIELYARRRPDGYGDAAPVRRSINRDMLTLVSRLQSLGSREQKLWRTVNAQMERKPQTAPLVLGALLQYMQIRYMYEHGRFWEPMLVQEAAPRSEVALPVKITWRQKIDVAGSATPPSRNACSNLSGPDLSGQPERLLASLAERGVQLHAQGEELVVKAPKDSITEEVRAALKANKTALLRLLGQRAPSALSRTTEANARH